MITMSAKYRGRCQSCGQSFEAGTAIGYDPQAKQAHHVECPPQGRSFLTSCTYNTACLLPQVGQVIERDGANWRVVAVEPVGGTSGRGRYGRYSLSTFRVVVEGVALVGKG